MDVGSYLVKVLVNGNLIPTYQYSNGLQAAQLRVGFLICQKFQKFQINVFFFAKKVTSANTPSITRISPISGIPGTFVTISGDFKTSCLSRNVAVCADDSAVLISRFISFIKTPYIIKKRF